jgi:hypothetical protein
MTLDLRGLSFTESFKQIRDAIALACCLQEEIVAFIEAHENGKCMMLKGLTELVLDCKTILEESNGFYMLKIMPSY